MQFSSCRRHKCGCDDIVKQYWFYDIFNSAFNTSYRDKLDELVIVASCVVCLPARIIFKEPYRKLEINLAESKCNENGSSAKYSIIS